MTDIADSSSISRPPHLVSSEVDGEMVVLDVGTGHFFHLNDVGSKVWVALDRPMTLAELCQVMQDRFDVDADTCRADIAEFVGSMAQNGLVNVAAR